MKMDVGKSGNFQVKTLRGHEAFISDSLYVNLGGDTGIDTFQVSNILSAGGDGTVRLWDVDSKKCISLCKLDSPVRSIVTSPDVTEVLAGDEMGRITRLKLPSLEVVTGFETDSPILRLQYIVSCVKGGVNTFSSAHQDGSIRFWKDFENSETVEAFRTIHTGGYYPDSSDRLKIVVNANQTKAVIYACDKDDLDVIDFTKIYTDCPEQECLITRLQLTSHIIDAGWLKTAKTPLFVCILMHEIFLFEIDNSKGPLPTWIHPITKHQQASGVDMVCLSMAPGRDFVVGGRYGQIQQYTVDNNNLIQLVKEFRDHKGFVNAIFATSHRVMSCSADFSIRVYAWKKEGGYKVLDSRYTLLGGSLSVNPYPNLTHVVHDQVSCVGTNGKLLKVYVFQD